MCYIFFAIRKPEIYAKSHNIKYEVYALTIVTSWTSKHQEILFKGKRAREILSTERANNVAVIMLSVFQGKGQEKSFLSLNSSKILFRGICKGILGTLWI